MSDTQVPQADEHIAEAGVSKRRGISLVWLIPVVAALIGGWLSYKAYTERGPLVTITFQDASGLVAGKTKLRFRDVDIGDVESVGLSDDLERIVVKARLVKEGSERFLTRGARFWVERPRITVTEVRGLDTLLAGVYIAVDPAPAGELTKEFVGLEEAPAITSEVDGTFFSLQASHLGSLGAGSPVYYRQLPVGEVVSYQLPEDAGPIEVRVFVNAPHDQQVRQNTRFWNASGVRVKLTSEGLDLQTQSLTSLLTGGVAFGLPEYEEALETAAADSVFELHDDREVAFARAYRRERMLMFFTGSVRGLNVGAPLEFRGIRVGEVVDIRMQFDAETFQFRIPVLVDFEPDRFEVIGVLDQTEQMQTLQQVVDQGMRAQLKSGSLVTGQKFIDLDLYPNAPPVTVSQQDGYPVWPTIPGTIEALTTKAGDILEKLERFPLEQIGDDLRGTIASARRLVENEQIELALGALASTLRQTDRFTGRLNADIAGQVSSALKQTDKTLSAAEGLVSRDSEVYQELRRLLSELSSAARSFRGMADYLERHPDALLRGKQNTR